MIHQVPSGSIVPSWKSDSSSLPAPLFDFDSVKNYVVPKPQLCNRLLTFKVGQYRVLGFPVHIYGTQYARNSFNFNLCFVFPYDSETVPYEGQISRMGKMFRTLEEQSQLLSQKTPDFEVFYQEKSNPSGDVTASRQGSTMELSEDVKYLKFADENQSAGRLASQSLMDLPPGQKRAAQPKLSSIESLIQQIYQDLNNYSECQIPIDGANSVDIKLFPTLTPPPQISESDVPVLLVELNGMVDVNWDPTMLKIAPFINGVNSVLKIAELAEADYSLTSQCIQHLIYYKSVSIIDIFQFSNCYAPTSEIGTFLWNGEMAQECQRYVAALSPFAGLPLSPPSSSSKSEGNRDNDLDSFRSNSFPKNSLKTLSVSPKASKYGMRAMKKLALPSKSKLFSLYISLHQGQRIKDWLLEHSSDLQNIDVRRFISYGILRNIIYRVREYPVSANLVHEKESDTILFKKGKRSSSGMHFPSELKNDESSAKIKDSAPEGYEQLKQHLCNVRDFDFICTSLVAPKKQVEKALSEISDWSRIFS